MIHSVAAPKALMSVSLTGSPTRAVCRHYGRSVGTPACGSASPAHGCTRSVVGDATQPAPSTWRMRSHVAVVLAGAILGLGCGSASSEPTVEGLADRLMDSACGGPCSEDAVDRDEWISDARPLFEVVADQCSTEPPSVIQSVHAGADRSARIAFDYICPDKLR